MIIKKNDSNAGFSLLEMTVTVAILAIISVLGTNFVISGLGVQTYVNDQHEAIVEARAALKVITSELKETVPADTGAYALEKALEKEIVFYSDVDRDNETERVRYWLDSTNLQRGIIEPSGDPLQYDNASEKISTLARYIENSAEPIFNYYNENYPDDAENNPLAFPVDQTIVRLISIRLNVNVDPNKLPKSQTLISFIHLRNLKENF